MTETAGNGVVLLLLGGALLAGYAAHVFGERTAVPRATLLLALGALCGPALLDVVPGEASNWFPLIAHLALAVVGFLLGEEFIAKRSRHSWQVIGLACAITVTTALVVAGAAWLAGASVELALVLGGIATATAPAATLDTIREAKARGPLTDAVLGVVAADDVLGVAVFTVMLAAGEAASGGGAPLSELLMTLWHLGGAVALGVALGFPMAWLTGRLREGEPALLEALGFVFLAAGLASLIDVSFILTAMVLGGTLAHRAAHHTRAVHEIADVSTPLLAVFFLFAGFALDVAALAGAGILTGIYLVSRIAGRLLGSYTGEILIRPRQSHPLRLGWCLLAQAGLAIGLALNAAERIPAIAETLLSLVIASTIVFELVGPPLLRWQLGRADEIPKDRQP